MKWIPRLLLALLAGIAIGAVGGLATFYLVARLGSCPPDVHVCDMPAIAAVGIGAVTGLISGLFGMISVFRRLRSHASASRHSAT